MDAVFAPRDTIDKRRLKALFRRSDAKGLVRLAGHLLALAASGTLVAAAAGTAWLVPALLVHGVILAFLFAPLHETIHYTAFRSRALNRAVSWLCGALLLLPPAYFRAFHTAHHRDTQDPARDPELARPKPRRLRHYIWHLSGLPYWRDQVVVICRHAIGRVEEAFIPAHQRGAAVRDARVLMAVYGVVASASLAAGSAAALMVWVVPVMLGQPALRGFLLAEHTGCPRVPGMLENSRTTKSNPVVRWLTWNMGYHAEHHAYPALPFHALPRAHGLLKDRIAVRASGYLAVHRGLLSALRDRRGAPAA